MGEGRVLFDASAYMLFEACGDSEIECFDRTVGGAFELESDAGTAEDDALSCSYGSSPACGRHQEVDSVGRDCRFYASDFVGLGEYFRGEDENWMEYEDSTGDSDEEDGVVDQNRGRCMKMTTAPPPEESFTEAAAKEKVRKSNGGEERKMSERERDRLFWENCLAS